MTDSDDMIPPWLSIVGIGEDGVDGLSIPALSAIRLAELVFGGRRHLDLAAGLVREGVAWATPFADSIPAVLARRGRPTCLLVSGDPFLHGAGGVIAEHVRPSEFTVFPAPSILSLACARLGWKAEEVVLVGAHARPLSSVRAHLARGARLVVLVRDGAAVGDLARELTGAGAGASILHVLEALGGPRERVTRVIAEGYARDDVAAPVAVAVEVRGEAIAPLGFGLPDALFDNDGQLTRREVRALTLSSLAPRGGELLWDVGLGAGSIATEWLRCDPRARAIGVESRPERAARARGNAERLGVGMRLAVVEGQAPAALAGLEAPDAIFVGGGASAPGTLEACWAALETGGRMVVNAVTLETEARLIAWSKQVGGALLRVAIDHAEPVGGFTGWRSAMPVVQWIGRK